MNLIKKWITDNKNEYWCKYVVIAAVLIVFAFAINQYNKYKDKPDEAAAAETSEETVISEDEAPSPVVEFLKDNKAHFIAFSALAVGLAVVEHKKKRSIKESR